MAWYRVERRSTDPQTAGRGGLTALLSALDRDIQASLQPATIARDNTVIYKRGDEEHFVVLIPPRTALAVPTVIREFAAEKLDAEPSRDGFKEIPI